jgi:rubredoxin
VLRRFVTWIESAPLRQWRSPSIFRAEMSEGLAAASDVKYRTFMCVVCGFIYNEAEGWPDDGIEAGTRWEDVPETWTCPDCGVTKSDFEMVEVG